MPDTAERLVNLALFLAAAREPVSAAQVQAQVAGYPEGQATATFLRMFERDKEDLLATGIVLEVVRSGETERYRLDGAATFAGGIDLAGEDAALLRAAGAALLGDPSFPFQDDLRVALAKVAAATGTAHSEAPAVPAVSLLADEDPEAQAEAVAEASRAIAARKTVTFSYTNLQGVDASREVEPFGVFARDGRWYLVGRDRAADGMRVFAMARAGRMAVDTVRPKTPDFDPPADFDIREWMALPFQYGAERSEAVLRLTGAASARAGALTGPRATVETADGGTLVHLPVSDARALASWAVANGPGVEVLEPPAAREELARGLRKVADLHG